jgi:hypothetical protein
VIGELPGSQYPWLPGRLGPATPEDAQIFEGTNQIQRLVIARELLKETA